MSPVNTPALLESTDTLPRQPADFGTSNLFGWHAGSVGRASELLRLADPIVASDTPFECVQALVDYIDVPSIPLGYLPEVKDTVFVQQTLKCRANAGNEFQVIFGAV